ncbi:MAG TPA: ABC transporter permease, partial [Nitrososphaeraceae archaeon]|nr:ABC transporter permease [Nitrososphaeraceae archaeon]
MQKKLFMGLIKSRRGIIGVSILGFLLSLTVIAVIIIPFDSYRLWNDPDYWINNPKTAAPFWTSYFSSKDFEHVSLDKNNAKTTSEVSEGIRVNNFGFEINIQADDFPDDFMFLHSVKYDEIPPVLQIDITRPDNITFTVYYSSLPTTSSVNNTFTDRIFSTNNNIKESLSQYQSFFNFPIFGIEPQVLLFSDTHNLQVLHGTYHISQKFFLFDNSSNIENVGVILGGKVFGIMGTDDLRRDLFVGIIWGIPIALFIGLTVSIFSISIGLIYGVVSGYKGKKIDEGMMRINDIFYAFPTLI